MSRTPHTSPGFVTGAVKSAATTTIAFIEDDEFYRSYLEEIVRGAGHFAVAGSYYSVDEAVAGLPPRGVDLIVIDVRLGGHSGIAALAALRTRWPQMRCVMLTGSEADEDLFAALAGGAAGYLSKSDSREQIRAALDELAAGGAPMSRDVARRVVASFAAQPKAAQTNSNVTKREREIMDALARGFTYKEIGDKLSISAATVKNHLSRIYEKLGVRSRTEAVVKWLGR